MRIGLFPGSFKPYHAGHHAVVERAAALCDSVTIIPSMSDRIKTGEFPIYYSDMRVIWDEQLRHIMPANVTIEFNKFPVRHVYEILAHPGDDVFVVYSDAHDITANFSITSQEKYFPDLVRAGRVSFVGLDRSTTKQVSGSHMRRLLQGHNKASFISLLPNGVDGEYIWATLGRRPALITAD